MPTLSFDAVAEEEADGGSAYPAVGPMRPWSAADGPPPVPPAASGNAGSQKSDDGERGLRRAVAVVSVALVAVVAALFGSTITGGRTAPVASGVYRSSAKAATPSTTVPPTSTTVVTTTTVPSTVPSSVPAAPPPPPPVYPTTTTVPPPPPAAPPVLTNLKPSSGAVGQSVVVSGSGFLSPSGRISATVGGRTAPVACPNQTTCTVTIPPQAGKATTVSMVIATDSGPSNPMTFRLT